MSSQRATLPCIALISQIHIVMQYGLELKLFSSFMNVVRLSTMLLVTVLHLLSACSYTEGGCQLKVQPEEMIV